MVVSHSVKIHILTIFFSNTILCSIFAIIILCTQVSLEVLIVFDDALVEVINDNRSISCHRISNSLNGAHLQEPINLHYLQACNGSTIDSITLNVGSLISN
jgi:hypothetical protein